MNELLKYAVVGIATIAGGYLVKKVYTNYVEKNMLIDEASKASIAKSDASIKKSKEAINTMISKRQAS